MLVRLLVVALGAALFPSTAVGQMIGPPLLVDTDSPLSETTIAVHASGADMEIVTGAIWWPGAASPHGPDRPLYCAISKDGGLTWPARAPLFWPGHDQSLEDTSGVRPIRSL